MSLPLRFFLAKQQGTNRPKRGLTPASAREAIRPANIPSDTVAAAATAVIFSYLP
jgi:hypothetical protein